MTTNSRPSTNPLSGPGYRGGSSQRGWVTPRDYLNAEFSHPALYRTSDQMFRTDPVVRAALMMVLLPLVEATWSFSSASPEPEDQEIAEFARRALLEHLDWSDVLWQLYSPALRYGHGLVEEVYETVSWSLSVPSGDGPPTELPSREFWVPRAYLPVPGESIQRWRFDDVGGVESVDQLTGTDRETVTIPGSSLVVLFNEREGREDLGRPVLRSMYRPWYMKEKLELIDALRAEKAGVGVPVGYVSPGAPAGAADALASQFEGFGANEQGYFVVDGHPQDPETGIVIEMLDMKAASTADVLASLNYHVTQILWAVLGAWQTLGQGEVGARATAEVQDDPFYLGLRYLAGRGASAFSRQVLPRLVAYNFPSGRLPTLRVGDIQGVDLPAVAEAVSKLLTSGAIERDDELEAHLREVFGLPAKLEADAEEVPVVVPDEEEVEEEDAGGVDEEIPAPDVDDPDASVEDEDRPEVTASVSLSRSFLEEIVSGRDDEWVSPREAETILGYIPKKRRRGPNDFELAHVSVDEIDATIEAQRLRFQERATETAYRVADVLTNAAVGDRDASVPEDLAGVLEDDVFEGLADVARYGRMTVRREVASQRARHAPTLAARPPRDPEKLDAWLRKRAAIATRALLSRLVDVAERAATRTRPVESVRTLLRDRADRGLRSEAVATVATAFNAGRRAEAETIAKEEKLTAVYSSVLDSATCDPCHALDGNEYEVGSDEYERDYPPLFECRGGDACRCMMVIVLPGEES